MSKLNKSVDEGASIFKSAISIMVYGGAATIDKVDSDILHKMQSFISSSNIFISNHAGARMFERGVSADDLITLITNGEIIEEYHDEYRCPAVLMLGQVRGIPHHIVVAICKDQLIIVTVYLPNEDEWIDNRRRK